MRQLTSHSRRRAAGFRRTRGRAATMLEFAMVLPVFLFMMLFTVDMGSLMLMSGAMNDAAYSAARAGAQAGGASVGDESCVAGGTCHGGVAVDSWNAAHEQLPFGLATPENYLTVTEGAQCTALGDKFVRVEGGYHLKFITPGLDALLRMIDGGTHTGASEGFSLTARGVSHCEIYRAP